MRIRIGVIGLGDVSALHLEAYQKVENVSIVAVADLDAARLHNLNAQIGARCYTDYRDMLSTETLDLVCVLTPAATHEAIVCDVARAGMHVLCEKPLAISSQSCRRMIDVCAHNGVQLFYGASYRFLPAIRAAKALIASGALGEIYLLREQMIGGLGPNSRQNLSFAHYPKGGIGGSGMGLVDHGVHLIDAFSWMLEDVPVGAFGRGSTSGADPVTEFAIIQYHNGAVGNLIYEDRTFPTELPHEGHFSAGAGWDINDAVLAGGWSSTPGSIHVYGSKGAMRIMHYANALYLRTNAGIRQVPIDAASAPAHFGRQLECFRTSLETERPADPSGMDGLRVLCTLEAIYRSAITGRFEEVSII